MAETKPAQARREPPTIAQDGSIPRSGLRIPMPASTKPPPAPSSQKSTT